MVYYILLIYGKNLKKICVEIYVEYFKKFHGKKIDLCNIFRKLNT